MQYNEIRGLLNKRRIEDKAFDWATTVLLDKAKSHFGILMKFSSYGDIKAITSILTKFDHNVAKHITNSYSNIVDGLPTIEGRFVIKIPKHKSFIYVSGKIKDVYQSNNKNEEITIYIFGKGAYRTAAYIKRKLDLFGSGELTNFSVTATKSGDRSFLNVIANDIAPRTFDTLFFDDNVIGRVKRHLDTWLDNIDIYTSRNLNFKTGILITGPAGTGKSSLAVAIASYLKCNLISIDMATFDNLDIGDLTASINADKDRYVVFLDEIDVIFKSRDDENITDRQRERTTKLLTFLDSTNSPSNVVFVATTNYPEKLDAAVTRKGRFDISVHVDNLSKETAEEMCAGFGTTLSKVNAEPDKNNHYNPASLQAAILDSIKKENSSEI